MKDIYIEKLNDITYQFHSFTVPWCDGFQIIAPNSFIIIYGYRDNDIFKMDYESEFVKRHNIYTGKFNFKTIEKILEKIL